MNHIQKLLSLSAITLLLAACGAEEGSQLGGSDQVLYKTTITGQVQQGNIKDAQVFLDLNDNGVLDVGEPKASSLTDAEGKFELTLTGDDVAKITPSSKIVSEGGTDTLNPAVKVGLLVSELPPDLTGSSEVKHTKHITPLTTLLAMAPDSDTKGKLKDILKELGGHKDQGGNDDFLIEGSSQAIIALAKSTEMILTTIQQSVATSTEDNSVSREATRKVARELASSLSRKTSDDLRDTEKLSNTLATATGTAVDSMPSSQLNVHSGDVVTEIKTGSLEVANAVKGGSGTSTLETTSGKSETEVMTPEVKTQITNAVNTAVTNIRQEVAPTNTQITTTKTATLAFTANVTAALPAPLQMVSITTYLPAGASVATNTGSNTISSSALVAGNSVTGISNVMLSGTYSATDHKVKITFTTTDSSFMGGEFARLAVSYQSPPALTVNDFAAPTLIEAAGYDFNLHSTVDLTGKLQAALDVTFN